MFVSRYFVWFVLFSIAGWIYETVVISIKHRTWENRGFLFGPMCPIYGIGAAAISGVAEVLESFGLGDYTWWQIFLVAFFGSMVLEYTTSWGLEKLFHAYWWDYSNVPLNVKGRICLPASLGFGIAGTLIVFYVYPFMCRWTAHVPVVLMELFSLLMMAVISVDLTLTVVSLRRLDRTVIAYNDMVNRHMDAWVTSMGGRIQSAELKLAEERERFSKEYLENLNKSSNEAFRSAIRRVAGFRPHYDEKRREQFERLLLAVKKRTKRETIKKH